MDNMAPPDGSRRRGLVMPTGGLSALLGLGAQDAGAASRLTRTPPAPHPPTAPMPSVTGFQRGHWAYAVHHLQTDTAARYRGFFTQVGVQGGELGGRRPLPAPAVRPSLPCWSPSSDSTE